MSWFIIAMQVGMWFGYITFGYVSDAIGRKRAYVGYLVTAGVLIAIYASLRRRWRCFAWAVRRFLCHRLLQRLWRGDGRDLSHRDPRDRTGLYLQPRPHRERRGAVYSRHAGATRGFDVALSTTSVAFLAAAVLWFWIPETKGRELA